MNQCTAFSTRVDEPIGAINTRLRRMTAAARAAWALSFLPGVHALSSSFGAQAGSRYT